jgi:hypothetical protein
VRFQRGWLGLLERLVVEARDSGELDAATDPGQLAFELNAMLVGANSGYLLTGDAGVLEPARRAIEGCSTAPDR